MFHRSQDGVALMLSRTAYGHGITGISEVKQVNRTLTKP